MSYGYGAILELGVSRPSESNFQDIICHLDQDSPHFAPQPTTNMSTAIEAYDPCVRASCSKIRNRYYLFFCFEICFKLLITESLDACV